MRPVSVMVGDVEVEAIIFDLQPANAHGDTLRFVVTDGNCSDVAPSDREISVLFSRQRVAFAVHRNEGPYQSSDLVALACEPAESNTAR